MAEGAQDIRRFSVRAEGGRHAQVVEEASFEAAAVAYLEDFAHAAGDDHELSVVVRNLDDGREQCFRIDLETGETAACG